MAELNTGDGGGKKGGGKVRSKKSNPGVDLTAMVDLAFLLITFFILTTTLSKPQSMNLALPEDKKDTIKYGNSRLHITLGTENVSIKPFYSNTMLEYADEYITKDASGIYEDNICVFQWDDDDSDAYLNKLPLTGFIQ